VLVVGGGVAGLRCAVGLADVGLQVVVVEAAPMLGGRAASWRDTTTGDTVDIGPHVLLSEYHNLLDWLQRLGSGHAVLWQHQPLITLKDGARVLRMPSRRWTPPLHTLAFAPPALRSVSVADLASNVGLGWRLMRMDEADALALDGEDALAWLSRHGVSPRMRDWFWASAAMALLNVPLAHCSAASLARLARLMLGRSGYGFGFPRIGLSELFAPVAQHLIERAGGHVLTSTRVRHLQWQQSRWVGAQCEDGLSIEAGALVLAVPPQALASLWPRAAAPGWQLAAHRYTPSPYLSTYLWFDRLVDSERFWARTWQPSDLNMDFYDLARIRQPLRHGHSWIAANSIHAVQAGDLSDDQIVQRTWQELTSFAPAAGRARLVHARVHRIPMAIVAALPGFEASRPPQLTESDNVWLAGDWTRTGLPSSMESAARAGALAAEGVARLFGHSLQLARPVPETYGIAGWLRRRTAAAA